MSVEVYLQFGPCQGETKTLTDAQFATGETTCKGATYRDTGGYIGRPPVHLFRYTAPPGGSGGATATVTSTSVYKAWGDVQNSVNHRMPTATQRVLVSQRRLLQTLIHKRRVRG